MQNLINITTNEQGSQVVNARELHEKLEVSERFNAWCQRMFAYGFVENEDYTGCKVFNTLANQELTNYTLTLDTAKEIAMLQRSEKGKEIRQYFIQYEKRSRALIQTLTQPQTDVEILSNAVLVANRLLAEKEEQLKKLSPKAEYVDKVLQSDTGITTTLIAKELGITARALNQLLQQESVQYKINGHYELYAAYANQGLAVIKTHQYTDKEGKSHTKHWLVWTELGRMYIHHLFDEKLSWSHPSKRKLHEQSKQND